MKCFLDVFLKRSLVFPIWLFPSISLHCSLKKAFFSLLDILWNSVFNWVNLSLSPFPFASQSLDTGISVTRYWWLWKVMTSSEGTLSLRLPDSAESLRSPQLQNLWEKGSNSWKDGRIMQQTSVYGTWVTDEKDFFLLLFLRQWVFFWNYMHGYKMKYVL